jgi:hypothetical protein
MFLVILYITGTTAHGTGYSKIFFLSKSVSAYCVHKVMIKLEVKIKHKINMLLKMGKVMMF